MRKLTVILVSALFLNMATSVAKTTMGIELQLEGPKELEITTEQVEQIGRIQKVVQEMAILETRLAELYKEYQSNKEAIDELQQKMRASQKTLQQARSIKQGLSLRLLLHSVRTDDITFQHGGDESNFTIKVSGPGAVNLPYKGMMTEEYRLGKSTLLKGGKAIPLTIDELRYGQRSMNRWLIAKPGDYEITVTYKTRGKMSFIAISQPLKLKVIVKDN